MPTDPWTIAQFVVNVLALLGGAAAWTFSVNALKDTVAAKSATIESVEKSRDFYKDQVADLQAKVSALERRSPEFMEKILEERLQVRENEIKRLTEDDKGTKEQLQAATRAQDDLRNELARTRGFRAMLAMEDAEYAEGGLEDEIELPDETTELTVERLGFVGVDSGQLMVTDPCYIDSEWKSEPMQNLTAYRDTQTGRIYEHWGDFVRFDESVDGLEGTVQENIDSGRLVEHHVEPERPFPFSYRGAANATLSDGYGELNYQTGQPGAGVVFGTARGDGFYPVYGEMIDGRIVRVYVNTG